jgi:hypothetical protein
MPNWQQIEDEVDWRLGQMHGGLDMSLDEYVIRAIRGRKERKIRDRLNTLQRRVDLFPLLRYVHGKKIAELTAELVAMRLEK